jgi:ribosome biogenesis GTPase
LDIGGLKETTAHKGKHTTVVRELFELDGGGFVADMPGLRSLSLWDMEPEELDAYFPELRDLVAKCQFSNCSHISEPGCAVKTALNEGSVDRERYESYIRLRAGDA